MATGKLKIDIRRGRILDYLARDGQVRVAELSRLLGATPATIRTDLDTLAAEGRLRRIQGGAVALAVREAPETQAAAATELAAEKTAIAWLALDDLPDGSTLFLNSGTTTLQLARTLACRKRLNVVTNSLSAAAVLALVVALQAVLPPLHADRALGATVQRMDALEAPAETVPPETNALYRASEAASVADAPEALGADLAALLDFLAGETLGGELPAEEPLARFVFPGGAVTLYEHGGALCYRDPVSGTLCETSRSLEDIKRFLAH